MVYRVIKVNKVVVDDGLLDDSYENKKILKIVDVID